MINISLSPWLPAVAVLLSGEIVSATQVPAVRAQTPTVIRSSAVPSCGQCRLALTKHLTLGEASDSVGPTSAVFSLTMTSEGRFFLVESSSANRFVFVYDRQGRLERTIGRAGEGPGEFKRIHGIASKGNDIFVFEVGGKFSVFDRHGRLVHDGRMPFTPRQLISNDQLGWIAWADVRSPQLAGLPIHAFDNSGRYLRSLRGETIAIDPRKSSWSQKYLSTGLDGFLALDANSKSIEVYTQRGALTRIVRLAAPWLSLGNLKWKTYPAMMALDQSYRAPATPPPRLNAVSVDKQGRLWVLGAVEDPEWRKLNVEFAGPKALPLTPAFNDRTWNSVIEIIDPNTGNLLHRETLPFYAEEFVGPGLLARPTEDEEGWLRIEIWRVELIMRSPRGR